MDKKKEAFLEAYKATFGNISQSCRAVGIVNQTYYNWKDKDAEFKKALDEIQPKEMLKDFLEAEAVRRLNDKRRMSDTLLIFMLKTKAKDRGYVERQEVDVNSYKDMSDEEIDDALAKYVNELKKSNDLPEA